MVYVPKVFPTWELKFRVIGHNGLKEGKDDFQIFIGQCILPNKGAINE